MWGQPLHVDFGLWCSAAWGLKGHGHSALVFSLAEPRFGALILLLNFYFRKCWYLMGSTALLYKGEMCVMTVKFLESLNALLIRNKNTSWPNLPPVLNKTSPLSISSSSNRVVEWSVHACRLGVHWQCWPWRMTVHMTCQVIHAAGHLPCSWRLSWT